jgi:hypothetical protein
MNLISQLYLKKHEYNIHYPIYYLIHNNLIPYIYKRITLKNKLKNKQIISTYSFYDIKNKLVFKLKLSSIDNYNNIVIIDVIFLYYSCVFNCWKNNDNNKIKLIWNHIYIDNNDKHLETIVNFIKTRLIIN